MESKDETSLIHDKIGSSSNGRIGTEALAIAATITGARVALLPPHTQVSESFGRDLSWWLGNVPELFRLPDVLRCVTRQCISLVARLHAAGYTHRCVHEVTHTTLYAGAER